MIRSTFPLAQACAGFGQSLAGRIRPASAFLFALGACVILLTSFAPPPAPAAASILKATTAHSTIQTVGLRPVNRAPGRASAVSHDQIDALRGVIARKYRVSPQATGEYLRQAWREANRNGLDPLLLIAVMAVESGFNPIAESQAGAIGLMQVIPRFHTDKFAPEHESILQPDTNIRVGAKVLQEYIRKGGGLIPGLQLYNGAADDESNAYAMKVLGEKERLMAAAKGASAKA